MLALFQYAAVCLTMFLTRGMYSDGVLLLFAAHCVFSAASMGTRADDDRVDDRSLGLLIALCTLPVVFHSRLMYVEAGLGAELLERCITATAIVAVVLLANLRVATHPSATRTFVYVVATLAVLLVAERVLVLFASPRPRIDVFTSAVKASEHLLAGHNPYSQTYSDIYAGRYDYAAGYPYWPGYLYWSTAWVAALPFLHDVRVSLIAAEVIAAVMLAAFLGRTGASRQTRTLAALLWLASPVALFVTEQAWIDSLLIACFAAAIWAVAANRLRLAGALLGYACGSKQYAALGAVLLALFVWRRSGWRALLRLGAAGAVVFAALLVPFLISDGPAFIERTLSSVVDYLPRLDALTLPAYVVRAVGVDDPEAVRGLYAPFVWFSLAACAGAAWWLWRRRAPSWRDLFVAQAVAYGFVFLFAKQAFCNYYHLLSFFVLGAAVAPAGALTSSKAELSVGA